MEDKTHTCTSIDAAADITMTASAIVVEEDPPSLVPPMRDNITDEEGKTEDPAMRRTSTAHKTNQSCLVMTSNSTKVALVAVSRTEIEGNTLQKSLTKKT